MIKTFQEFITELFDFSYSYDGPKNKSGSVIYEFETEEGQKGEISFDDMFGDWHVDFTIDGRHNITNKGEAIKIFSTIITIIKDFIDKKNPRKLSFVANKNEPSRVSFYEKLTDKLAKTKQLQWEKKDVKGGITFIVTIRK